jgi:hypothetical protein
MPRTNCRQVRREHAGQNLGKTKLLASALEEDEHWRANLLNLLGNGKRSGRLGSLSSPDRLRDGSHGQGIG